MLEKVLKIDKSKLVEINNELYLPEEYIQKLNESFNLILFLRENYTRTMHDSPAPGACYDIDLGGCIFGPYFNYETLDKVKKERMALRTEKSIPERAPSIFAHEDSISYSIISRAYTDQQIKNITFSKYKTFLLHIKHDPNSALTFIGEGISREQINEFANTFTNSLEICSEICKKVLDKKNGSVQAMTAVSNNALIDTCIYDNGFNLEFRINVFSGSGQMNTLKEAIQIAARKAEITTKLYPNQEYFSDVPLEITTEFKSISEIHSKYKKNLF